MPDASEQLTCYLCSKPIDLEPRKQWVTESDGRRRERLVANAPTFVSLPLYRQGEIVRDGKGQPVSVYVHLHPCWESPSPEPREDQQRLL